MRIAAKFTIGLISAIALVLTVQAYLHYRHVAGLQEHETRDDLHTLARAIAGAASEIWANAGPERADAYVRRADARRARTRIALRRGEAPAATTVRGDELVVRIPLDVGGAFVELGRSLDLNRAFRHSVVVSQIATTVMLVLVSGLLAMVLGVWLIGRPVAQLIDQTRRVASGDLAAGIELGRRDELGKLASELNSMTAQLREAEQQLAAQRRLRAALQAQLRHADRLSTVGKVASGIAHELGTPLNVVAGRASMIASQARDEEIADNAHIIAQQAQRMTAIIRELLDFSRRRGVQRQDARIREVIDQARTLLEPIAEDRGVHIATDEVADLRADIDVNKTLQVLTNLMMNAVQAMPDGGTLRISAHSEHVAEPRNDHAEPGDYLAITVTDEGVGIAADDLEHIFQPFFTTKRAGRGTGLGLYVCHGIVREQLGWMEVTSEPGRGSTFTVFLPQHESRAEGAA